MRKWNKNYAGTGAWGTTSGGCAIRRGCLRKNSARSSSAGACDIGRTTYAKYESGELNIRVSVLMELRSIYGCAYDDFFEGLEQNSCVHVGLKCTQLFFLTVL